MKSFPIYLNSVILSTLVNKVPVLSKITLFTFKILSKIEFFLIKIEFSIAKFKVIVITQGIANPKAQGQLATNTEIAL